MLEFGFPIGYTASHPPAPHTGNHPSANQHPADIDAYLNKELRHSAIIGPADRLPFQWPRINSMMTRPKKDSSSRRVMVDLSMPQDASVNSGIPRNSLDGAPFKLRLPNPATLANQHPADIDAYLNKELRHSAIIGPADHLPFQWPRTNPMMTRPKKDSSSRRVIVDLSMPQDASVNSGIPRNSLDGAPFKLRLPNPATLAAKILGYGQGCLLYKVDLSRAYRQLRTDPLDCPFLMLQWDDQHYLDISIPFGLRHGASACQRTTEAVSAIAKEEVGADTAPYIDDTIGAALPQDAWPHYLHLLDLMSQLRSSASHDVQLEVWHKPGADMIAADTLSRATTSSTAAAKFAQAAQESEGQPLPSALLPPFPFQSVLILNLHHLCVSISHLILTVYLPKVLH